MLGSSNTYNRPCRSLPICTDSRMRWLSPPAAVHALVDLGAPPESGPANRDEILDRLAAGILSFEEAMRLLQN